MKKLIQFLMAAMLISPLFAAELKKELPAPKGNGDAVLLLCGNRPWVGVENSKILLKMGFKVTLLSSEYLAGLGGAPIRANMSSSVEPDPKDGITPAFEQLGNYKLVVVNAIPTGEQLNLFTPERIAALQKYVKEGGHVLLTRNCPAALGEMLPVTPHALVHGKGTVTRPDGKTFASLPKSWPMMEPFRLFTVRDGATELGQYVSENGNDKAPFLIQKQYGNGLVTVWNGTFEPTPLTPQTFKWSYGKALLTSIVKYAMGAEQPAVAAGGATAQSKDLPAPRGKGPSVLLLCGNRPWVGEETARTFLKKGLQVTLLSSEYLDGLGGAPIRANMASKIEPKAKDGITPAFQQLGNYKLVVVNAIPTGEQLNLFTPDRIEALQLYVHNGGHVLLTRNCPAALGEMLPVKPGALIHDKGTVTRPADKTFAFLPETWQIMEPFRRFSVKKGATTLGLYESEISFEQSPFLIQWKYGDGLVTVWNGTFEPTPLTPQTFKWSYGRSLLMAIVKYAGEFDFNPETK